MSEIRIIKALKTAAVFALIFTTQTRLLAAGDSEKQVLTNRYLFQPEQSTIVQTGGFASVHYTYTVEGQFILNVDFDAHTATFEQVDANAMDNSQYKRTLDPNEVFNMTSLEGVVQDNTTIVFTGKQEGGSAIQLTVTLQDDSLHLAGNTTPPPGSADFFIFNIDALAKQKYSGGTGEPNEPYKIAEPNNWVELMNTSFDWDKNFIMTSDIDMNGISLTPVGTSPIKAFKGIFDGNDHIIHNADVNMPDDLYVGLFNLGQDAEIRNLGIKNIKVIGRSSVGGLVGENWYGNLNNCYTTGSVIGNSSVGGLVGWNSGNINKCDALSSVEGNGNDVGGLIGLHFEGDVTMNSTSGSVKGRGYVGGLIGDHLGGNLSDCNATCTVTGADLYVGGLVGYSSECNFDRCYATGNIIGNDYVGGLIGMSFRDELNSCYATGSVTGINMDILGGRYLGGLIGYSSSTNLTECYATGAVNGPGYWSVGGLSGTLEGGRHYLCYASGYVTGDSKVGGLAGASNVSDIILCYAVGSVHGKDDIGGLVGENSSVIIVCFASGSVIGTGFEIGGLIGNNSVSLLISDCYAAGSVVGYDDVGGLVGWNSDISDNKKYGIITRCYSSGSVSADKDAGGLLGINFGHITDSFWDIETSGKTNMCATQYKGGTGCNNNCGKTSIEMQVSNTFKNAGWDFIGETVNGPNDVWWILEGKDYPRLWWQLPVDDFNDSKAEPLWFAYEIEPELAHLEEVNGRLEVYTAGATEDIDAIYAPYNWGLDANKPFAAKVDFHFSKIGIGDGRMNIGIVPGMNPEAMKWAEFEVGTFDENPFFLYEIRDGFFVEEKVSDRFVDDGTLYVSYDPNSDELYFSNTNYGKEKAIWTISGLIRGRWQTDSVYIILSGGSEDGMALTGQDAWLDNFKVSYGAIWQ